MKPVFNYCTIEVPLSKRMRKANREAKALYIPRRGIFINMLKPERVIVLN